MVNAVLWLTNGKLETLRGDGLAFFFARLSHFLNCETETFDISEMPARSRLIHFYYSHFST